MKPIIEIQNISKKYRIRGQESPYLTLRDSIMSLGKKSLKISKDEFWALKDINFNVYPGESIGIIGRNGAGKSTLLKILSRITPPTKGRIISRGRVASLLEVGTGFHAELTGRENIYLNGSILGLRKEEINKKFDEIVDFSGVEKFLDTPLKHYSSGMQLRLAFAVAAHLEPEILVIDEVLSVGDAEFQKKSLGKMEEVTKQGRTVLFVSHNMAAVQNLCSKGVLIDNGKVKYINDTKEVISRYISYNNNLQSKVTDLSLIKRGHYKQDLIFDKIIFDKIVFPFNETITFYIELKSLCDKRNFNNLDFGVAISNNYEQTLIHISNRFINKVFNHDNDNDLYKFEIENNIKPGNYNLTLFLRANNEIQDWLKNVITIKIEDGNPYEYSNSREIQGVIFEKFNINKVEK